MLLLLLTTATTLFKSGLLGVLWRQFSGFFGISTLSFALMIATRAYRLTLLANRVSPATYFQVRSAHARRRFHARRATRHAMRRVSLTSTEVTVTAPSPRGVTAVLVLLRALHCAQPLLRHLLPPRDRTAPRHAAPRYAVRACSLCSLCSVPSIPCVVLCSPFLNG